MSYDPHSKVLPQCAANIASIHTEIELMRRQVDDTHKLLTQEVIPTLAVLVADKPKRQSKLLKSILHSTATKIIIGVLTIIGLGVISLLGLGCEEVMHRTEGEDYVIEDTDKRRFIDQALPGEPGTVDTAEYNNAVQEELCYLIEQYGGDCNKTAVTDRAAGWTELHDTIFLDENITTSAIDNISVSKLSQGTLSITNGDYVWTQDEESIEYVRNITVDQLYTATFGYNTMDILYTIDATSSRSVQIDALSVTLLEINSGVNTANTVVSARGIKYGQRFGTSTNLGTAIYRKEAYTVTSVSWSGSGPYTGSFTSFDTGLPWDTQQSVVGAWVQGTDADSAFLAPATLSPTQSGNTVWIASVYLANLSIPTGTSIELILEYDASDL